MSERVILDEVTVAELRTVEGQGERGGAVMGSGIARSWARQVDVFVLVCAPARLGYRSLHDMSRRLAAWIPLPARDTCRVATSATKAIKMQQAHRIASGQRVACMTACARRWTMTWRRIRCRRRPSSCDKETRQAMQKERTL